MLGLPRWEEFSGKKHDVLVRKSEAHFVDDMEEILVQIIRFHIKQLLEGLGWVIFFPQSFTGLDIEKTERPERTMGVNHLHECTFQ